MKKATLSALVLTIALFSFSPTENPLESLIAGFKKYLAELPQEKIYLHLDRPYYTNGDTIWVKAYLTEGAMHLPSSISRTIYLELINDQKQLVKQAKLLSINGSAAGMIALTDSLKSGNYLVRAYTQWMRNSDEDYFFHRQVKIWNRETPAPAAIAVEKPADIRFFPEGGDMVAGFQCKVAFKATGPDGLGRKISGKIVDESGAMICEFKSNFLGMGALSFTPRTGKTYKAIVDTNGGEVKLPPIKESGLVMSVKNEADANELMVRIQTTDYTTLKSVNILAQTRGVVCYATRLDLSANFAIVKIPKSKFPTGVAQITVADSNGVPIAERLTFVNDSEQLSINIISDKESYAPREQVNLQILATDSSGNPVAADLSMAVCDDSQVLPDENRETISSYLFLSSELRGNIESPGYYFNTANEDRGEALDYLLLTQGWRRFTFKKALEAQWPNPEFKIEKGLTIKGKMVDKENNKPIADGKVTFQFIPPQIVTAEARTNTTGDFELNNIIYFDSARAVLQGEAKKGFKGVKFTIDNKVVFPATNFSLSPLQGTQTEFEKTFITKSYERKNIDKALNLDKKTILLKTVEVRTTKDILEGDKGHIYGLGTINKQVAGDPALENMTTPLQLLQGRVPGMQVIGLSGNNFKVIMRGVGTITQNSDPMIMIDNMPMFVDPEHPDQNTLQNLSVRDIESYSVWTGADAAIFGARGANGVIGFYTKKGGRLRTEKEGIANFREMGFQPEREFYVPKYDMKKPEHKRADERTTLVWVPHILTDSTGRASVSFYNHDLETSVTGIVEGISGKGEPGVTTFKYSIKKN